VAASFHQEVTGSTRDCSNLMHVYCTCILLELRLTTSQ